MILMRHWIIVLACAVLGLAGCRMGDARLVPLGGMEAQMEHVSAEGKPAVRVTFKKIGEERRLVAVQVKPEGKPIEAKAVVMRYRVQLKSGQPPKFSLTVFEKDGTTWFKVGTEQVEVGAFADGRLPITTLRLAEFSKSGIAAKDAKTTPNWENVKRIWIGLVVDGPAEGTFELSSVRFTSEPFKPTRPLRATGAGPGEWTEGHDKAVQATLSTPNEGPEGKPCMKYEFKFPGGRHMYAIPSTPVLASGVEGYKALRFRYKATLPPGIKGLLVTLGERGGGQYYADPAPPASAEWTTVTIPFENFKFATWSKDENGKLDLDMVERVMIGAHGTASGAGGNGLIMVSDIEFLP